jgi:hypothetical protein
MIIILLLLLLHYHYYYTIIIIIIIVSIIIIYILTILINNWLSNDIFALPNSQEYHSSKNTLFYYSSKITTLPNLFLDLPNEPFFEFQFSKARSNIFIFSWVTTLNADSSRVLCYRFKLRLWTIVIMISVNTDDSIGISYDERMKIKKKSPI